MSIEKDLLVIFLFMFIFIIKYLSLKKKFLEQRNYFIQTLSHDLRVSAIAQIRGLEFVYKDESLPQFQKEMISCVSDSCKFTLDMINMLLNTYKFDRNEAVLNYEYCNIAEVISNACKLNLMQSAEKEIELVNLVDNIFLNFDKIYIFKLINILLSTAIFYSKKNSIIKVLSKESCDYIEITILYSGDIITEEEKRRMFSKNSRFSTVGHGIKMHLCKKIIDFHKGRIYVNKHSKNLISFTFKLPMKKREKSFLNSIYQTQKVQYSVSK